MEHLKMLTVSKCLCLGCLGFVQYVCAKIGVQKRQERLAEWLKKRTKGLKQRKKPDNPKPFSKHNFYLTFLQTVLKYLRNTSGLL